MPGVPEFLGPRLRWGVVPPRPEKPVSETLPDLAVSSLLHAAVHSACRRRSTARGRLSKGRNRESQDACRRNAAHGCVKREKSTARHWCINAFKENNRFASLGASVANTRRTRTMGRGRDRGQNRRSYDDDQPTVDWGRPSQQSFRRGPREDAATTGPALDASVKWFNAEKGFGFVELDDESGDAFLHAAVLEAAGHDSVDPGAKLSVQVGVGQKGRQITAVLAVDASTAAPERRPTQSSSRSSPGRERHDPSTATTVEGTVKWFKSDKGFGFVIGDDGGKDVFVHISVVERSGLGTLGEGRRVSMKVITTPKGREAISITMLD